MNADTTAAVECRCWEYQMPTYYNILISVTIIWIDIEIQISFKDYIIWILFAYFSQIRKWKFGINFMEL